MESLVQKGILKSQTRALRDVFVYTTALEILNAFSLQSRAHSRNWSINSWAKKLDLPTNGILINILKGRRLPSPELSIQLARSMELNENETEYFLSLIEIERASLHAYSRPNTLKTVKDRILKFKVRSKTKIIQDALFSTIADPIHFVIRECIKLKSKPQTFQEIRTEIGGTTNEEQIEHAVKTLLRSGLLVRDESGNLKQSENDVETENDRISFASRSFHKASLESAIDAINRVGITERHFTSYVFAFEKARLKEAKADIEEFINQFTAKYRADSEIADEVYQVNVQFIPRTRKVSGDSQ